MKTVFVRSMSLPDGVPVPHFESVKEVLAHLKTGEAGMVELINKYGRQKDSLVNAREFLSDEVEKVFKRKVKPAKNGEVEFAETETQHLDHFAGAAIAGKVTVEGLKVEGKDEEEKTASVWKWLQAIVTKHGDFPFDLNAAERVGKARKPEKYALNAAQSIINGGPERVKAWVKNLSEGFEAKGYGRVNPVPFLAFDTPDKDANVINLARAIEAVEAQKAAKNAESYK